MFGINTKLSQKKKKKKEIYKMWKHHQIKFCAENVPNLDKILLQCIASVAVTDELFVSMTQQRNVH